MSPETLPTFQALAALPADSSSIERPKREPDIEAGFQKVLDQRRPMGEGNMISATAAVAGNNQWPKGVPVHPHFAGVLKN